MAGCRVSRPVRGNTAASVAGRGAASCVSILAPSPQSVETLKETDPFHRGTWTFDNSDAHIIAMRSERKGSQYAERRR
jgi:hypothetical protein